MADLSIQFHARPAELVRFVEQCVLDLKLHVTATDFPPFRAKEVTSEEIRELILAGLCRELVLSDAAPCLPVGSELEFWERNPGALTLVIGRETPAGLTESWLACRTAGSPVNAKWKKIASRLRSITKTGTIAVNQNTGMSGPYRNHRYTAGAQALFHEGVPILPMAGGTILKLGVEELS